MSEKAQVRMIFRQKILALAAGFSIILVIMMEKELQAMPSALRILADEIKAPDDIPEMCLRDAAAMIESLVEQRDDARLQAEIERDKHCHPDHGGHLFSWEGDQAIPLNERK